MTSFQQHIADQDEITAAYERREACERATTRADLMRHPAFADLESDSCGNPCVWDNHYYCAACGECWSSPWSCKCDEDCPCGNATQPEKSDWLGPANDAQRMLWEALPEKDGAPVAGNCADPTGAWGSDPDFPPEDWIDEVRLGHTRLGYEQWLKEKRGIPDASALKSYEIDLAVTVSAYATVTVQAESLAAALEKVRADAADASSGKSSIWDEVKEDGIDWSTEGDYRVLEARNVADVSDAATGVDLVTDSFDVISADHLTMQLEAKAWNDTIAPMTLEQRLDQTPDPDAEAFSKYVMFGK
jgi:hypothetical protein